MPAISDQDFYWLIGILEGEGCFMMTNMAQPVVRVEMTDEDIINKVGRLFEQLSGGEVNVTEGNIRKAGWSIAYTVQVKGKRAKMIMQRVVKYMGHRRRQRIWQCLNGYKERQTDITSADIVKLVRGGA